MQKIAVVTGAGRSIGKSIAFKLAEKGYFVLVNSYKEENAKNTVNEINEKGFKAIPIPFDVSNFEKANEVLSEVLKQFKQIHVLVNNAGISKDNLLLRQKVEDINRILEVNLLGQIYVTKILLKNILKSRNGSIVNISSVIGLTGNIGQTAYAASKAGIIGFSKSLAREVASRNIRVNVVAPGFIKTDMTSSLSDSLKEEMLKRIPLAYFAEPEDVANLVCFLVSDDARYITGQVINIDGGMLI